MCLGIPAQITKLVDENNKLAMVDLAGVSRVVNISCLLNENYTPQDCIGNWVLVHVGFAMNIINEEEAHKTLELLKEIGELSAAVEEIRLGSG